jgi:hypothetical protein
MMTSAGDRVDVIIPGHDLRLEVKYSNSHLAVRHSITRRWSWLDLFGRDGGKSYNRVILVGDADPRFVDLYKDRDSPFVMFDLSFEDARKYYNFELGAIKLSTNPRTARTALANAFYNGFQVTRDELAAKYRQKPNRISFESPQLADSYQNISDGLNHE